MSKLRIEQQKNESADLFAIRAFAKAIPLMERWAIVACAKWVYERADAELKSRDKPTDSPSSGGDEER